MFPISVIDVTILPRFQSTKNATQEHFAESQHLLVFLWRYWNTLLLQRATKWGNGQIFMPDSNALIMEQVRAGQLHAKEMSDASGVGKQAPLFEYVQQPCLALKQEEGAADLQAATVEKCVDPARHLFW